MNVIVKRESLVDRIYLPLVWARAIGCNHWIHQELKHPGRTAIGCLLTLPHDLIFGPIWFLIALAETPQKVCPFCKSTIPAAATVCAKCTRSLV